MYAMTRMILKNIRPNSKKSYTKEFILYVSIYMKFCNRQLTSDGGKNSEEWLPLGVKGREHLCILPRKENNHKQILHSS